MRINQYLAYNLGISRRKAEDPVTRGLVRINGVLVTELFTQVNDSDTVEIFQYGRWDKISKTRNLTIIFYKPTFTVSTHSDPEKRRTIFDLLPPKYQHLKSAGRLDFMSEGLMVLSTDGELIQELTHPSRNHNKLYLVGTSKLISGEAINKMKSGNLQLEENILAPMLIQKLETSDFAKWDFLKLSEKLNWYSFELSEGRNNQIRKVCQLFGVGVTRLIRVQQGELKLTPELLLKKWIEV